MDSRVSFQWKEEQGVAHRRGVLAWLPRRRRPRAGYVVKEMNAARNTITVTRGPAGKPLVPAVARDTFLPDIKTLADLKAGTHVALHLVTEGGAVVVLPWGRRRRGSGSGRPPGAGTKGTGHSRPSTGL